jgi:hypothetical protein
MPWEPTYTRDEAVEAIGRSSTWADALRDLGLSPHGKNFRTIRKWASKWEIDASHLPAYRPRKATPRFTEQQAREAIAGARSWSEALRNLGYCTSGANPRTLQNWAARWGISTDHFDPYAASREALLRRVMKRPIEEILVPNSTYCRSNLKARLYDEGLKQPVCELCGQGEAWRGKIMGLILDHVNGVRNDNRIENLRIVCPNCAATLDTHCGKNVRRLPRERTCARCGESFRAKKRDQRYCSRECGIRWDRWEAARRGRGQLGRPKPEFRRAGRPPYEQLKREIAETSYLAVGRRYGVSDNAIRKWVKFYERQMEREAAEAARAQEPPEMLDEAA